MRNLRSEAAFRECILRCINKTFIQRCVHLAKINRTICNTSNIVDWRIIPFFFFFLFKCISTNLFAQISLQMGGSRDIDRLTNCEEFFENVRRNAIITKSTKISRWMRAGYNWMSRKMAALPAIFYRNRFRRFNAKVPGKRDRGIRTDFVKCAPNELLFIAWYSLLHRPSTVTSVTDCYMH